MIIAARQSQQRRNAAGAEEEQLGKFAAGKSKYYQLYFHSGKLSHETTHLRRDEGVSIFNERRHGQRPGAKIKCLRYTTSGATGNGLGTTAKYLRAAAGIGLGTTTKYLRRATAKYPVNQKGGA
jgi:hypothetical protein